MLAAEIQAKVKAGLSLCGQDEEGNLEWIGETGKFKVAERYEEWLLEHGRLPHDSREYKEMEPNVFNKR